jgi:hypothetical protein
MRRLGPCTAPRSRSRRHTERLPGTDTSTRSPACKGKVKQLFNHCGRRRTTAPQRLLKRSRSCGSFCHHSVDCPLDAGSDSSRRSNSASTSTARAVSSERIERINAIRNGTPSTSPRTQQDACTDHLIKPQTGSPRAMQPLVIVSGHQRATNPERAIPPAPTAPTLSGVASSCFATGKLSPVSVDSSTSRSATPTRRAPAGRTSARRGLADGETRAWRSAAQPVAASNS